MIYAIVVTYNATQWLDRCFGSLIASKLNKRLSIIAIDNASTDNTVKILKERYPQVELIENRENLGFGKANNIGLKKAIKNGADFVFLLNQDAWLELDAIDKLVESQRENPEYWIISPIQNNSIEGSIEKQFEKYLKHNNTIFNQKEIQEVDFVNAAAWLISRECIERVGGFDPLFPHYGEDNDYINRVHHFGGKVGVLTSSIAYHDRMLSNIVDTKKMIYKTTLIYISILKDINRTQFLNFLKNTYTLFKKVTKSMILFDLVLFRVYLLAYKNSLLQWHKIKLHRRISKKTKAFID